MDLARWIFYGVIGAAEVFVALAVLRFAVHRLFSGKWPRTKATIRAEYFGIGLSRGIRGAYFTYDITLDEIPYSGRFALLADEQTSRRLLRLLTNQPIEVRYNPRRPAVSFLLNPHDFRFEGVTASQNPLYFILRSEVRSDMIELFPK